MTDQTPVSPEDTHLRQQIADAAHRAMCWCDGLAEHDDHALPEEEPIVEDFDKVVDVVLSVVAPLLAAKDNQHRSALDRIATAGNLVPGLPASRIADMVGCLARLLDGEARIAQGLREQVEQLRAEVERLRTLAKRKFAAAHVACTAYYGDKPWPEVLAEDPDAVGRWMRVVEAVLDPFNEPTQAVDENAQLVTREPRVWTAGDRALWNPRAAEDDDFRIPVTVLDVYPDAGRTHHAPGALHLEIEDGEGRVWGCTEDDVRPLTEVLPEQDGGEQ